jgi:L-ascorbate metabolism protein UlaG (beta-lactamase superfamily)
MKLTKFGHACVRLEEHGAVLVIDPGGLTEASALEGADVILITNENYDHVIQGRIRAAADANHGLQIWTVGSVAELLPGLGDQLHVVEDGDSFDTAGFHVEARGRWHGEIHADIPVLANTGFLIDRCLFHPGDALTVPEDPVDTLMVPVHASWARAADIIDWVRAVRPRLAIAMHDGGLNRIGLATIDGLLGAQGPGIGSDYLRLEPGTGTVTLDSRGRAAARRWGRDK